MKPIKKAIFPVGGFGTRFLPATKAQPKEMLPIVDKPVIQYLVEEAVEAGIEEIVFVTGRGKRAIEDHFDTTFELEYNLVEKNKHALLDSIKNLPDLAKFTYVRQPKPKGDGHAILCAKHVIGNEPCAVLFGDDVIKNHKPAIKQLIEVYNQTGSPVIGLQQVDPSEVSSFGVIGGTEQENGVYQVNQLVEKPKQEEAPSNLAIVGKYVITPETFTAIESAQAGHADGELRLIDGFKHLISDQAIYAKILEGKRFDCGSKLGLIKATIEFALDREDLGPRLREYLRQSL